MSTPHTPKELNFKSWQPKEPGTAGGHTPQGGSMAQAQAAAVAQAQAQGRVPSAQLQAIAPAPESGRRERTREHMSVGTSAADKDGPPSKVSFCYYRREIPVN